MSGLIELISSTAVDEMIRTNPNAVITFSAHWCGPCKASKPALEALVQEYTSVIKKNVVFGIIYENNLGEAIHQYNVRAFPTYVLYQNNGTETNRVQGANIPGIRDMIDNAKDITDTSFTSTGTALGGGTTGVTSLSPDEARLARLARLGGATTTAAAVAPTTTEIAVAKAPVASPDATTAKDLKESKNNDAMDIDKETTATEEGKSMDVDTPTADASPTMIDPTTYLNSEYVRSLTEEMGFTLIRAQKGLLNGNGNNVEGAIEWLATHQDDADIDEPIALVPDPSTTTQSYRCVDTGKIFRTVADLELHAMRTGHTNFEEVSTGAYKPLTAEEKIIKINEIKELLRVKRAEREEKDAQDEIEREKQRRFMGKEMLKTKEQLDQEQRKREAYLRRKEKDEFQKERIRLREQLARDKAERAASKGKLASKLSVEGYKPDMLQYNDSSKNDGTAGHDNATLPATTTTNEQQQQPPLHQNVDCGKKIDECITKVSSYKAGGDGGKCLKILKIYITNVLDHPKDDKYRIIKLDNNAYKTKVKPFIGAKQLLLYVGFQPDESKENLILSNETRESHQQVLLDTKTKLESALVKY